MDIENKISLRERIRLNLIAAMENANINQVQLAEKLNISKGTVNNWTRGNNSPDVDMVPRICKVLGISILSLYSPTLSENHTAPIHETKSDSLSHEESIIIKKYRILDEYGKEIVDSVLDIEHKRYIEQAKEKTQSEDAVKIMYIQYNDQKASAGEGFTLDYEYMQRWGVQYNELTKKADFCVDVQGDSMEPRFYDGDTLLIRRQPAVDVGEIGLFILDEKGYVKKWGGDRLISLNPAYEDIEIEENSRMDCAGKVLGVLDPDWIIET